MILFLIAGFLASLFVLLGVFLGKTPGLLFGWSLGAIFVSSTLLFLCKLIERKCIYMVDVVDGLFAPSMDNFKNGFNCFSFISEKQRA